MSRIRLGVTALLVAALMVGGIVAAMAAGLQAPPVPPGTKRTAMPPSLLGDNSYTFVLVCAQPPAQSYALVSAALKKTEWQIGGGHDPAATGVWMIMASLEQEEGSVTAIIQGKDRGGDPGSALFYTMSGPGVTETLFDHLPKQATTPKPDDGIPPDIIRPGLTPPGEGDLPPGTPPNAFQKAMDAHEKPLTKLIDALIAWCENPTAATRKAALAAADKYIPVSTALQNQCVIWGDKLGTSSASARILSDVVQFDSDLGLIVLAIEKGKPADQAQIRLVALPRLKKLKEEKLQRYLHANKRARELVDVAREPAENQPVVDTPLPEELILQTEEPPFEPSTKLNVNRFWIPTKEYWEGVLPETWQALRCWNAGCPEHCEPIDEGRQFDCKAFGTYSTDPSPGMDETHCLNIGRSDDTEKQYLSHPLTLYGLASLSVEVGDPKQLEQGGRLDVQVDGETLFSIPLPAANRPYRGSNSPYGEMEELEAKTGHTLLTDDNVYVKWAEGVKLVFGEEAARDFRNCSRSPYAVLESAGGEFNGYVFFATIGQAAGQAMVRYDMIMPPMADIDPLTLAQRLMQIAEKNHPALEKPHTVTITAEVGGVISAPVEIEVPAVFGDLQGEAGTFGSWPGGEPSEWKFDEQLGAPPTVEAPPRVDVDPNASVRLYEDTKKMAMVYTYIIVAHWLDRIQKELAGLAYKNFAKDWTDTKVQNLLSPIQNNRGVKLLTGAVKHYVSLLPNDQVVSGLGEFTQGYVKKTIEKAGYGKVKSALGLDFKETAKQLRKDWNDHTDPTVKQLRPWAHLKVCTHRRMIKIIGEAAHDTQRDVYDPIGNAKLAGALTKCIFGPPGKAVDEAIGALCDAAEIGVAYADINAIREIWYEVEQVKKTIDNPEAWLK